MHIFNATYREQSFNRCMYLAFAQCNTFTKLVYSCFSLHVKSVFRNYDHDHDGYISQEDFESIAANFPFLDSFCVLDKDQ